MSRKETMLSDDGFIFTGSAVALGARLDVPRLREVRASLTLPSLGGTASASEGAADVGGIVRYRSASTSVTGESYDYRRDDTKLQFETRVACSMEGFEYGDAVRADFISATLVSTFLHHHRFHEETVTLRGLWANGQDRILERRTPKCLKNKECKSFEDLARAAEASSELVTDMASLRAPAGRPMPEPGQLVMKNGRMVCYLFDPSYITFVQDGIKYELFLGEYVLDQNLRRLTMLRIESRLDDQGGGASKRGPAPKSGSATPKSGDGGGGPQGSTTAVQPIVNGHKPP
jgi:hypothetical protein